MKRCVLSYCRDMIVNRVIRKVLRGKFVTDSSEPLNSLGNLKMECFELLYHPKKIIISI